MSPSMFVLGTVCLFQVVVIGGVASYKTCSDYQNCECNSTHLICNGTFGDDVEVFRNVPRDLEYISITGNSFTNKLPVNLFGNCTQSRMKRLKLLDLSHNNITHLHGKTFHCLTSLETLILSHNEWHVNNHTHVFAPMPGLKRLDLENTFIEKLNGTGHLVKLAVYLGVAGMTELEELNLADNEFWFLPIDIHNALCALKKLKILNLSKNRLQHLTVCPDLNNLVVLDLSYNHLPWLGKKLLENITRLQSLKELYLDGNLFQCDCGMKNFYSWLKNETESPHVQNRHHLKCYISTHGGYEGVPILDLTMDDLTCGHDEHFNATGVVIGLLFTVIIVMFVIAMYYNRVLVKETWKRIVGKPVTLALIPQSQGYSTVEDKMGQI